MKSALLLAVAAGTLSLTSCAQTTLENRRDMYFPQTVNGPYTRMLHNGIPSVQSTTTATEVTTSGGKAVVR